MEPGFVPYGFGATDCGEGNMEAVDAGNPKVGCVG